MDCSIGSCNYRCNRNMKNTINQTITNGDNNVQAGGDVKQNVQGDEE